MIEANEEQKCIFEMEDDAGTLIVKGNISGASEVEFYDDLKLKAVIALLNSVDQEHFVKAGKAAMFYDYVSEIEETMQNIKRNDRFQGGNL